MNCPICSRGALDDMTTFCRRCGWHQGPEDESQRAARREIALERWAEILSLRQIVAELQTTCVGSVSRVGPDESAGTGASFGEPTTGMEFVCVPGGGYAMGDVFGGDDPDQRPVHTVALQSFCLGRFPVTQAQWQAVMGENPSAHLGLDRPVDSVSWEDCQGFLEELGKRSGVPFRLPTEAEWEYAARSCGRPEKWAGTSSHDEVGSFAWFVGNSGGESQPVGIKRPNRLGLHDLSGNIWEWCQD